MCIKRSIGSFARTDSDNADTFAEYFVAAFTDEDPERQGFDFHNNNHIGKFSCTVQDVIKVVNNLKRNSAPGPDNIPALFLKKILHVAHIKIIANPLAK